MLKQSDPETAKVLLTRAQEAVTHRWQQYKQLASMSFE
jgi:hypothetical protein